MEKKEVLAQLVDAKKAAILKVLLNSKEEICLKEIATKSKVSLASTFRILQELVQANILERKEWKNSKTYRCLENSEFLRELFYEEFDGLGEFVKALGTLGGVQSLILHGAKKKDKASVILIGDSLDNAKIEGICSEIRQKGFEINFMTLTQNQYEQMSKMGLYSGEKKVIK